jgi:hypothetical protein
MIGPFRLIDQCASREGSHTSQVTPQRVFQKHLLHREAEPRLAINPSKTFSLIIPNKIECLYQDFVCRQR